MKSDLFDGDIITGCEKRLFGVKSLRIRLHGTPLLGIAVSCGDFRVGYDSAARVGYDPHQSTRGNLRVGCGHKRG